jgi:alpha-tubulin suppressor-like RCC1 family protein
VRVSAPAGVSFKQVVAGDYHSVAVGVDGNAYAWGDNEFGQLGNGSTTDSPVPVRVSAPAGVSFKQVVAGRGYTIAISTAGNTYAWGRNGSGELGNNSTANNSDVPVRVSAPAGVSFIQVSAGVAHVVAVGSDKNAYSWGANTFGQLGNNGTANSLFPVRVSAPSHVAFKEVVAGDSHSVAVGDDGNTYSWGNNRYSQLGNNESTNSLVPVRVSAPDDVSFAQVTAGGLHSIVLGSDGKTYAWGNNGSGQLGNGSTNDSRVPVPVGQLSVVSV